MYDVPWRVEGTADLESSCVFLMLFFFEKWVQNWTFICGAGDVRDFAATL
jgi:hypothetical protein